jgi:pimeloyl-ACP methyl ester carboxylesterase
MTQPRPFTIETHAETLAADRIEAGGRAACLLLHGAGTSHRGRWLAVRQALAARGIGSIAIDFSGHGESSARTPNSLAKRHAEALAALDHLDADAPRSVIGISMSGEIAVRLAADARNRIDHLVILVGAAYDADAFATPFGPAFSAQIRREQSWRRSQAFAEIAGFRGDITLVRAGRDSVIPPAIADLLLARATSARQARIVDLPGAGHMLSQQVAQEPMLMERLCAVLAAALRPGSARPA